MKKTGIIFLITILVIFINSCQNKKETKTAMKIDKKDKYDFMASSCAPMAYPAEVVNGDFYLADGTSLYIPAGGRVLMYGWHDGGAAHVTGPDLKALPTELQIKWLSIAEKKFYAGRFKLDYDLILKLFKKGFYDHEKEFHTYRKINAGVAPGGVVVVWLDGLGSRVEIGRFKAKETKVTIKKLAPNNPTISLDEYVKEIAEGNLIDEVKTEMENNEIPFGLWDTYRIKYNWQPKFEFANGGKLTVIQIDYFNGETILTYAENPEVIGYKPSAIPKFIGLDWEDKNGNKFGADLKFAQKLKTDDYHTFKEIEKEIFDAFKKLNASSTAKQLDLIFKIDKYNSNIKLYLKNENEEIELKKMFINIYENN